MAWIWIILGLTVWLQNVLFICHVNNSSIYAVGWNVKYHVKFLICKSTVNQVLQVPSGADVIPVKGDYLQCMSFEAYSFRQTVSWLPF